MDNKEKVLYGLRHQIEDADWLEGQRKDNVLIWVLRDAYNLLKEQESILWSMRTENNVG